MNYLAALFAVFVGLLVLLAGSALVTICAIFWKKRTIAIDGDDPLPGLPRNRAQRRAYQRAAGIPLRHRTGTASPGAR